MNAGPFLPTEPLDPGAFFARLKDRLKGVSRASEREALITEMAASVALEQHPALASAFHATRSEARYMQGKLPEALEDALAARRYSEAAGLRSDLARAMSLEGRTHLSRGDVTLAIDRFSEALEVALSVHDLRETSAAECGLGLVFLRAEEFATSLAWFRRAEAAAESSGSVSWLIRNRNNIANALFMTDRVEEAREMLEDTIRLSEARRRRWLPNLYHSLAECEVCARDWEKAIIACHRAIEHSLAMGHVFSAAESTCDLARSFLETGRGEAAFALEPEVLRIIREVHHRPARLKAIATMGRLQEAKGELRGALDYLQQQREIEFAERKALSDRRVRIWEHQAMRIRHEEMEVSDRFLAGIAATVPGVLFRMVIPANGDYYYTFVSERSLEVLQLAPTAFLADPRVLDWPRLMGTDWNHEVMERALRGESWTFDTQQTTPEGHVRYLRVEANLLQRSLDGYEFTGIIRDVTERILRQAALRQSEAALLTFLEGSLDGYALLEPVERSGQVAALGIVSANGRLAGLLGSDASDLVGADLLQLVGPEASHRLAAQAKEVLRSGRIVREDRTRLRTDSAVVEYQLAPSGDRMGLILRDLTHQLRLEDRLRESEERWSLAVQGANDGVWDFTMGAEEVYLSGRAREILGMDPELRVAPRQLLDQLALGSRFTQSRAWERLRGGQRQNISIERPVTTPEGERRWVLIRAQGIFGDRGPLRRLVGTLSDITERKRIEHILGAVAESTRLLLMPIPLDEAVEQLLATVGDACEVDRCHFVELRKDPETGLHLSLRKATWSSSRLPMPDSCEPEQPFEMETAGFGDWVERLQSGHGFQLSVGEEADPAMAHLRALGIRTLLLQPIMVKGACWGFLEFDAADPQHAWSESVTSMLGTVANNLAMALDQQRYQLALVNANQDLKSALSRSQELTVQAQAANRAKTVFVANVSHEIRTPIHGVLGLTEILLGSPLSPEVQESARGIHASAQSLLEIVNDILDFAKIESGRVSPERIPVDLRRSAREVRDIFRTAASAKGIPFEVEVEPEVPLAVLGDPVRLRQILVNLVGNALKFTSQGQVACRIGYAEEGLIVRVTDSGIGIPAERLESIFDSFVQADDSVSRLYGGTGLGLTIAKGLVDAMQGTIAVESRVGQGSTFEVRVPAPEVEPPRPIAEPITESTDIRPGLRVLLCEDNPINILLARQLLESFGCEVEVVGDGQLAVERCRTAHPPLDLILMDIQMPGVDGLSATRQIRQVPGQGEVPIVALTASAMEEDRQACRQAGMNDFLAKPFKLADFRSIIQRWGNSATSSD